MRLIIENARFRLLWFSGTVNNLGIILYFTVHGWLTLAVTDSAFWVGATAGVHGVALVVFSVLAGVLADRFDRRRLLLYGQTIQAAMAFAIAALVFTEQIALWHILLAGILEGMVVAVKVPCRMTLTQDVVGRERLLSATAASMVSMTAMGIAAPLVGGFVVGVFDIAWGYVIIGSAYLVASLLLVALRDAPRLARTLSTPWQDMKSGVRYVFVTPAVRALILLGVTSEVFGWAHESMLPVMARDVLKVGPQGLGYLLAAGSIGGFLSTLVISSRRDIQNKRLMLLLGYAGFGAFLVLFAFSPWFGLSLVLLAAAYACAMAYESAFGTLLQTTVPDEVRGRVVSFQLFTWGLNGVSGFHTGAIAAALGAPIAIAAGGGVVILNALRMARRASRLHRAEPEAAVGD